MDFQFGDNALEILKWVGLAFAAGFIGYFGRYLSMFIIDKVKKRKEAATKSSPSSAQASIENSTIVQDNETAKMEKKRRKSEIKKAKKESKP